MPPHAKKSPPDPHTVGKYKKLAKRFFIAIWKYCDTDEKGHVRSSNFTTSSYTELETLARTLEEDGISDSNNSNKLKFHLDRFERILPPGIDRDYINQIGVRHGVDFQYSKQTVKQPV